MIKPLIHIDKPLDEQTICIVLHFTKKKNNNNKKNK